MTFDPMLRARELLSGAASWQELRRRLDEEGLAVRLGAAGLEVLAAAWHGREARALSDRDLAQDLAFWAEGGGFTTHLRGYNAIPPSVLVEEACSRGWFVRMLPSGGALVNPPGGRPLRLRLP